MTSIEAADGAVIAMSNWFVCSNVTIFETGWDHVVVSAVVDVDFVACAVTAIGVGCGPRVGVDSETSV